MGNQETPPGGVSGGHIHLGLIQATASHRTVAISWTTQEDWSWGMGQLWFKMPRCVCWGTENVPIYTAHSTPIFSELFKLIHSFEAKKGPMSLTFGHTHPGIVRNKSPPAGLVPQGYQNV